MRHLKNLILLLLSFAFAAGISNTGFAQSDILCAYPTEKEDINKNQPTNSNENLLGCNESSPEKPCPYNDAPILCFKVNVHYIQTAEGGLNFTETDDGMGGSLTGYGRAEQIIKEANWQVQANSSAWGLNPPPAVCDLNFRVQLQGVYFHRTNIGLNAAGTAFDPWTLWSSYLGSQMVNPASEINIFIFESTGASGIASGNHVSVHNVWSDYFLGGVNNPNSWYLSLAGRVLWHEIFHTMGLGHPFQGDGCDDTVTFFPQCWAWNSNPNHYCHTHASNNVMDYNEYPDWSLTPCQICIIHQNYDPAYLCESPCGPAIANFFLDYGSLCCDSPTVPQVFMYAASSLNETKHSIEIYQVLSIGSTTPVAGTYFSQSYNGPAGDVELGAYCGYTFQCGKYYRIKLTVQNKCPSKDEEVKYNSCLLFSGDEGNLKGLKVVPNPASDEISLEFYLHERTALQIQIINSITGKVVKTVSQNNLYPAATNTIPVSVGDLYEGVYMIYINDGQELLQKQLIIHRN